MVVGYIENVFTYHEPNDNQRERYEVIRNKAKELAYLIGDACPDCADKDTAIDKIRECVMYANAAIAITESVETPQ